MNLPVAIESSRQAKQTQVFTFYSFKGGVGRSMAVINVAALLARAGRRVLIIDLDLEAPGITYLAEEAARPDMSSPPQPELPLAQPRFGFVDALYDLIDQGTASPLGNKEERNPLARYIRPLDLTRFAQAELEAGERVQVDLMPAGKLDDPPVEYRRRLSQLAFEERFRRGDAVPVLQHFKNVLMRLEPAYDYVLVDSRTGLAAEASAAVGDLADHLIFIMGLNLQNRQGSAQFLRMLRAGGLCPQTISLVISPLPIGEDDLADRRLGEAEAAVTEAWNSEEAIKAIALIPYHPRIALDEQPHRRRRTNEHLSNAYARLADRLASLKGEAPGQIASRFLEAVLEERWADAAVALNSWPRGLSPGILLPLRTLVEEKLGSPAIQQVVTSLERFVSHDGNAAYLCAVHFLRAGDAPKAESIWKTYLDRAPAEDDRWLAAADFWENTAKDPPAARKVLQQALEKLPRSAKLWHSAAVLNWQKLADRDSAEDRFLKALGLNPREAGTHGDYAVFLWEERGRLDEAEQHYLTAIELAPKNADAHGNYANFLCDARHHLDEAEQHYLKALELAPQSADAHGNYATFLCDERGRLDEAERHYLKALELEPENAGVHANYATFLWEDRGRTDEAEQHYLKSLKINPAGTRVRTDRVELLLALDRLDEARRELLWIWGQQPPTKAAHRLALLPLAGLLLLLDGESDRDVLGRLLTALQTCLVKYDAHYDALMDRLRSRLSPEDLALYAAIAAVLSGKNGPESLNEHVRWRSVKPLPLDGPLFTEEAPLGPASATK